MPQVRGWAGPGPGVTDPKPLGLMLKFIKYSVGRTGERGAPQLLEQKNEDFCNYKSPLKLNHALLKFKNRSN